MFAEFFAIFFLSLFFFFFFDGGSSNDNDINKVGARMKLGYSILRDAPLFTLCNLIRNPCLYLDEVLVK